MDPLVAAAVLTAALLHATWHALVKSSGDGVIALAGMNLVAGVVASALLPFVLLPTPAAAVVIAISVILHAGYKIALASLYARADLSQGYPLARGMTPIFAAVLGFVFLKEVPAMATLAGVLAISVGVLALAFDRRGSAISAPALIAAIVVAVTVAAYSALDAYGIRMNGDWLGFTAWLVACDSAAFIAYAFATRGTATLAVWRSGWLRTLTSGVLGVAAFGVFMWALSRAQVGAVTALRETSVLFAALIGAFVLRESVTRARAIAAVMVMGGAAAIPLFR